MKSSLRSLVRLACLPLLAAFASLPTPAVADTTQESLATIGVTAVGGGQTWAYLTWVTNSQDLLDARTYALYSKPGPATSASPYTRVAIVQVQMDPAAIGALLDRAAIGLGENTTALDEAVRGLFQDLMPSGSITTAERVSAVVRGSIGNPTHLKNLMIAAKSYPSLSMALGRAHAAPIPVSGQVTFEVREYDSARQADVTVVGRSTVDGSQPLGIAGNLPAPSTLISPPLNPALGKNDMVIKFVWDTPVAFRQLALMTHGFNLYRVGRAFAESNGFHTTPPGGAILAGLATSTPASVQRVNRAPITPDRALSFADLASVTYDTVFFSDHHSRFPAGWPEPVNGDQYYYFVTPRDILGRDLYSNSSPGLLGTFCSRMPPAAPRGVRVSNHYTYTAGVSKQVLKVQWNANPVVAGKTTTAYAVYRWNSDSEIYQLSGNPTTNLVTIIPAGGAMEYIDDGSGSPAMPADTGKTFWYTVRAIDDGTYDPAGPDGPYCNIAPFGGNLSGQGGPAFGVLRDRVGPSTPTGTLTFLCPEPQLDVDRKTSIVTDERLDETAYRLRVEVKQVPADVLYDWAEYYFTPSGGTSQFLGRYSFTPGAAVMIRDFNLPWDIPTDGNQLRVRVGLRNGKISPFVSITFSRPQTPKSYLYIKYQATIAYNRVAATPSTLRSGCDTHYSGDPSALPPGVIPGIVVSFMPPTGTRQWKVYTRVDAGELTLAKEDSGDFNPATLIEVLVDKLPAVHSRICFFVQVFDINGNPSAMENYGCVDVEGSQPLPVPLLADVVSSGSTGSEVGQLQWFCAPYGVHHFEVWVSADPTAPADDWDGPSAALLKVNSTYTDPNFDDEIENGVPVSHNYKVYDTERVGPLFGGSGATFTANALATQGTKWRLKVRAVSGSGQKGEFSNIVEYQWAQAATVTGPDVPWPTRALPTSFPGFLQSSLTVDWLSADNCVGIRVGRVTGRFTLEQEKGAAIFDDLSALENWLFKGLVGTGTERTVLPVVVYRVQEDDGTGNYPPSGDIVQVTPMLENIADATEFIGGTNRRVLRDPFFSAVTQVLPAPTGTVSWLYIKDTQPVIGGCRYRYLLVLLDPTTKEVVGVVPTPTIDIAVPSSP